MKKITFLIFLLVSSIGFSQPTTQPTITGFSVPAKLMGDAPFAITPPTSNSTGAFSYTSSNTGVATISGSTITIVGVGTSTITANQAADGTYTSGSTTALFTVTYAPPMDAAPTPYFDAAYVMNYYSSAYTEIAGTDWNPNWGQTTVATEILIDGNATRKMANLNYQGVQFAAPQNISTMNNLHLDLWTPDCTSFKVSLISAGAENAVTLTPMLSGWNSFDIDLTGYNVPNLAAITQLKFESVTPGKEVYLDNIFFWQFPILVEAPSLPIDFESSRLTYTFDNIDGGVATKIANPNPSGINTSANVARMIKGMGEVTAGSAIYMSPINLSENNRFKVKVFSPRARARVNLFIRGNEILPNGSIGGAILNSRVVPSTVANAWEELTFDFSDLGLGSTTIEIYALIFVFDEGTIGDGSANYTFLVDDISFEAYLNVATFEASNIRMFPNPTYNVFKIEANDVIENVSLYNVLGQEVLAKTSNSKSVTLDVANLQTGVYVVKTMIGGVASTSRLVKN